MKMINLSDGLSIYLYSLMKSYYKKNLDYRYHNLMVGTNTKIIVS